MIKCFMIKICVDCSPVSLLYFFVCFQNSSFPFRKPGSYWESLNYSRQGERAHAASELPQSAAAATSHLTLAGPPPGPCLPSTDSPHSCSAPGPGLQARFLVPGTMPHRSISIKAISKMSCSQLLVGQAEEILPTSASWVYLTQLLSP